MCSIFAHTLYYLCNLIFAKECLKTYDALIHYLKKIVILQFNMRSRRQKTAQCKYNLYQHIK